LFPLEPSGDGTWYVRQWAHEGEGWDLFCLNPKNTRRKAAEALAPEIAVAAALPTDFTWGSDGPRKRDTGTPKPAGKRRKSAPAS
jgi:hypothetical protein